MAELAVWIWTSGALWIGRLTLASIVLLAALIVVGHILTPDRPRRHRTMRLPDHHPYVRPHDTKDHRT